MQASESFLPLATAANVYGTTTGLSIPASELEISWIDIAGEAWESRWLYVVPEKFHSEIIKEVDADAGNSRSLLLLRQKGSEHKQGCCYQIRRVFRRRRSMDLRDR